jgi:ACS family hexuronate transporter-like MFS transporter
MSQNPASSTSVSPTSNPAVPKAGHYRWLICSILFVATTINYIDRNVLSFTMLDDAFRRVMLGLPTGAPLGDTEIALFKERMGYVDAAFKFAYAIGFVIAGWMIDRIGTRRGFSISITVWSIAGIVHGFVNSVFGMTGARFLLGLGEAGNFPSCIKSVAEWFPRKERSFATGLFNAGSNVGIIVTAACIPFVISALGWRASFILTGAVGSLVLVFWLMFFHRPEEHPKVSQAELAYIRSDGEQDSGRRVKWGQLIPFRATWAFGIGKFLTDAVWWFYLTWLPSFFNDNAALTTKLDLKSVGIPFIVIYLISDGGSIFFGWLATRFIHMGWSVNRARKTTMLICALCVVPIFFASMTSSIVVAIALISLATAAHQGWSANLFTTVSDMFPKRAVGSVTGIGGMMGGIGGALLAAVAGKVIGVVGYWPLFIFASCAYLIALAIIQALVPRLEQVKIADE